MCILDVDMIFSLLLIQEAQYQQRQQKIRSFCQVLKMQEAYEHGERQNVSTLLIKFEFIEWYY